LDLKGDGRRTNGEAEKKGEQQAQKSRHTAILKQNDHIEKTPGTASRWASYSFIRGGQAPVRILSDVIPSQAQKQEMNLLLPCPFFHPLAIAWKEPFSLCRRETGESSDLRQIP
jgi:hypothetical protein